MKNRIDWIDHVRGLAIVLVILFHSGTLLRFGFEEPEVISAINGILSPYRMPILVFLSGFIAHLSLRKTPVEFVWGKMRNLLWPYVVWTLVYAFTVGARYSVTDHELYISYLWFLMYVFCYYFAAWAGRRVPRLVIALVAFTASAAIPEDIDAARRFFFLWGVFALGEVAHEASSHFQQLLATPWSFLGLLAVAIVTPMTFLDSKVLYNPLWLSACLAGLLIVCAVAVRLQRFSEIFIMRALSYVGRHSLIYYVTHFPIIWGTLQLLVLLGISDTWLAYLTSAMFAFALGSVISHASRYKVVNFLFQLPKGESTALRKKLAEGPVAPQATT